MSKSQVIGRIEQAGSQGIYEGWGGFAMMDVGGTLVPKYRSVEGEKAVTDGFGRNGLEGV